VGEEHLASGPIRHGQVALEGHWPRGHPHRPLLLAPWRRHLPDGGRGTVAPGAEDVG